MKKVIVAALSLLMLSGCVPAIIGGAAGAGAAAYVIHHQHTAHAVKK